MEKTKKKTGAINIKDRKNKYEVPLSLNTWEEKVEFLHNIHQEIQEKRERSNIYQDGAN
jgi:hypothetical protein